MKISWHETAWEDYVFWQETDKKIVKKINDLLKEMVRTPFEGTGKPEPLRGNLSSYWSRRITGEHRIVYTVKNEEVIIAQCRYHY